MKKGKYDLEELKRSQQELAENVVLTDKLDMNRIEYVAGVDQSFVGEKVISACALLKFPSLEAVKGKTTVENVTFPYIPTFLMFREGMPAVRAVNTTIKGMDRSKVVIVVDGSGIAHPRKCGLACYVAVKTGLPTIGITKKRLFGEVEEPQEVLESKPILDGDEVIGYTLKTCKRCKPIYISPGGHITPRTALSFIKECLHGYKLPEPVRAAHELATEARKKRL
ncbi:MAG: endonuclease V [Archaeoglobaceae archaeon]